MMNASSTTTAATVDSGLEALCAVAAYYRIGADPARLAREPAPGACAADEMDLVRALRWSGAGVPAGTSTVRVRDCVGRRGDSPNPPTSPI